MPVRVSATPPKLGKFIAGLIGLGIGSATTYYLLKDYQLIKFEPVAKDQQGDRKLKVSFREMQPLQLTPEAAARAERAAKELEAKQSGTQSNNSVPKKLGHDAKEELEQIIQDPTT